MLSIGTLIGDYLKQPIISSKINSKTHSSQINIHDLSILIVDDNLINQRMASANLRELVQNNADIAATGSEAFTLLNKYYYSLIFVDIDLPDISGFEEYQTIKKSYRNDRIPIVIATSHREKQIRKKCFALGADAVITKTLDFDVLKTNLPFWLNKNNSQRST